METKLKIPFRKVWSEHLSEWQIRDCDGHHAAYLYFETEAEADELLTAFNDRAALLAERDRLRETLNEGIRVAKMTTDRLLPDYVQYPLTGELGQIVAACQEFLANSRAALKGEST